MPQIAVRVCGLSVPSAVGEFDPEGLYVVVKVGKDAQRTRMLDFDEKDMQWDELLVFMVALQRQSYQQQQQQQLLLSQMMGGALSASEENEVSLSSSATVTGSAPNSGHIESGSSNSNISPGSKVQPSVGPVVSSSSATAAGILGLSGGRRSTSSADVSPSSSKTASGAVFGNMDAFPTSPSTQQQQQQQQTGSSPSSGVLAHSVEGSTAGVASEDEVKQTSGAEAIQQQRLALFDTVLQGGPPPILFELWRWSDASDGCLGVYTLYGKDALSICAGNIVDRKIVFNRSSSYSVSASLRIRISATGFNLAEMRGMPGESASTTQLNNPANISNSKGGIIGMSNGGVPFVGDPMLYNMMPHNFFGGDLTNGGGGVLGSIQFGAPSMVAASASGSLPATVIASQQQVNPAAPLFPGVLADNRALLERSHVNPESLASRLAKELPLTNGTSVANIAGVHMHHLHHHHQHLNRSPATSVLGAATFGDSGDSRKFTYSASYLLVDRSGFQGDSNDLTSSSSATADGNRMDAGGDCSSGKISDGDGALYSSAQNTSAPYGSGWNPSGSGILGGGEGGSGVGGGGGGGATASVPRSLFGNTAGNSTGALCGANQNIYGYGGNAYPYGMNGAQTHSPLPSTSSTSTANNASVFGARYDMYGNDSYDNFYDC